MSPGVKMHLAAVGLDRRRFSSAVRGCRPLVGVLVALGEVVRLDHADVLERRRIAVDDDVVDHLERREIERAQILRHERPEVAPCMMCASAVRLATRTSPLLLA